MKTVMSSEMKGSNTTLQSLYLSSKNWLSYIDFFEDEIKFFRKLIEKQYSKEAENHEQILIINREIKKLESQKNLILNNIFCYQSNLRATMEEMMQLNETYLIAQHQRIQEEVKFLQPAMDLIKNRLYVLSERQHNSN